MVDVIPSPATAESFRPLVDTAPQGAVKPSGTDQNDVSNRLLAAMSNVENQLAVNQRLRAKLTENTAAKLARRSQVAGETQVTPQKATLRARQVAVPLHAQDKENIPRQFSTILSSMSDETRSVAAAPSRHHYNALAVKTARDQELKEREKKILDRERQVREQEGVLEKRRHSLVLLAQNLRTCTLAGDEKQHEILDSSSIPDSAISDQTGIEEGNESDAIMTRIDNDGEESAEDGERICDEYDCDWNECIVQGPDGVSSDN